MKMSKEGHGPTEIARRLNVSLGTVEGWIYQGKVPPLAKWYPEPSNELAYVLGVLNGDGSVHVDKGDYRIQLKVKDYEFTETFSKTMSKLLNKKIAKPIWGKTDNRWTVMYQSKAFYMWYKKQNLESLKLYIEYSRETVANFLRGLYDSDGGHYKSKGRYSMIYLSNNNLKLLKYTQYLLREYFGITATGPYINVEAGTKRKIKGKMAKANHDGYQIDINRKKHTKKFLSEIGFSITERQLGLPRRK